MVSQTISPCDKSIQLSSDATNEDCDDECGRISGADCAIKSLSSSGMCTCQEYRDEGDVAVDTCRAASKVIGTDKEEEDCEDHCSEVDNKLDDTGCDIDSFNKSIGYCKCTY